MDTIPEHDTNLHNSHPELELWARVMKTAIQDLESQTEHMSALAWFKSHRDDEGSFLWICTVLDLEPVNTRRTILDKYQGRLAA